MIFGNDLALSFFNTHSSFWSLTYFFTITYLLTCTTTLFYLVPNIKNYTLSYNQSFKKLFSSIPQTSTLPLIIFPVIILFFLLMSWSGPTTLSWYSHLLFSNFQYRLTIFMLINFLTILLIFSTSHFFTTNSVYDFLIILYNFLFWIRIPKKGNFEDEF